MTTRPTTFNPDALLDAWADDDYEEICRVFETAISAAHAAGRAESEGWQPIDDAPMDDRVVLAYFGPESRLDGFTCTGYFFKWPTMEERAATGWPLRDPQPTHFARLAAAPKQETPTP